MSTLRNIAAHLWRGSHVRKANVVLGVTGAALSAACAAEQIAAPTSAGPRADGAVGDLVSSTPALPPAPAPAPLTKAQQDSLRQYNAAQLDSLKADFAAYKRAVGHGGGLGEEVVRCAPKPAVSITKVIGPKGGMFNIGPHTFQVPAGALDSNVTITATAPTSSADELQFQPHGLLFNKPVQMTINYKGCVVPKDVTLGVSYLGHLYTDSTGTTHAHVKERMPAHNDPATTSVSALTDHFSGYAVTWSRQTAY